jgi:hypothetical protein
MATLMINRSSEYANALRNIKIFLDNKEIGTIANGEAKEFDVPEGVHTLQAKIDWCSSPKTTFIITSTGKKSYNLSSFCEPQQVWASFSFLLYHFWYRKVFEP